ncbi:MerR family transcriptional regulator [Paenibacillus pinihumi]|uniref:MerR family transcriptional regulator n=1 Tax=Paenibacillus pinihumi TaxID=669462 RepID=UPI000413C796|nr:MerR family transcriptional regulator [Paenibacillus pinihumi]
MEIYTAKQLADILQQDEPQMNLRTVRYYTQIGLVPPLELAGNKRVYTKTHLHYFRAILTLTKSGDTLAAVAEKLNGLTTEEVAKIGESLRLYQSGQLIHNDTVVINEDLILSVSPRMDAALRSRVIETVTKMMKGEQS